MESGVLEKTTHVTSLSENHDKNEAFRQMMEQAGDMIYVTDYYGFISYCNPACKKLTGYSMEELEGKRFIDLVAEESKREVEGYYINQADKLIAESLYSFPIVMKDGTHKWIEQMVMLLRQNGKISERHVIARDFTEKKNMELRLKESEEKFSGLVEAVPYGLVIVNKEGKIVMVNNQATKLFGYTKEEIIGQAVEMLVPQRFQKVHASHRQEYGFNPRARSMGAGTELFGLKKDGSVFPADISLGPIFNKGKEGMLIVSTIRDLTEKKKLQEKSESDTFDLLTSNKEIESFSYVVSHDLRIPIRAINGFANVIKNNYADRIGVNGNELLDIIVSESVRMGKLIDDLLSYIQLRSKEIRKSVLNMNDLVNNVLNDFIKSGGEKSKTKIRVSNLDSAYCDPGLTQLVFFHLISNAIKFSETKIAPEVEVGSNAEGNNIVFYVKDNGVGFDNTYANKLYSVFQRLHAGEFEGNGIGLAIVKRVIIRQGGKVWAEGKVNEGATFYFSLPKNAEG